MIKINEHSASLLLMLLLSSDIVFNGLHVSKHLLIQNFSPAYDQISTYLEIYHLVKLFWIIVLFVYILVSIRYSSYLSWILVFTFFIFDDALLIHQRIGDSLDIYLPDHLRLSPRLSQLVVLAIVGLILLVILSWTYFRSQITFRKVSKDMMLFMAALLFFGLIADLAAAINLGQVAMSALDIIEDGGEMVVFSLILWYVFLLAIRRGNPDLFLLDLLSKSQI